MKECMTNAHKHNQRTRYTHGFLCEDCNRWFGYNTPVYRELELLSSVYMVLSNINVDLIREGLSKDKEVTDLMNRIGISKDHSHDFEELIYESQILMFKHGKNENSASFTLE